MSKLKTLYQHQTETLSAVIHELCGEVFDIDNDKQLLVILKDKLGLPIEKIDAESLAKLDDGTISVPHLVILYRNFKLLVNEAR